MRTSIRRSIILCAFACLSIPLRLDAQPPAGKVAHDLARNSYTLGWVEGSQTWDSLYRTIQNFDNNGRPTQKDILYYNGSGWTPVQRTDYRYVGHTDTAQTTTYAWSGTFLADDRTTAAYDTAGRLVQTIHESWNGATWDTVGGQRYNYWYDTAGRKTQVDFIERHLIFHTWDSIGRLRYIYGAGPNPDSIYYDTWSNGWQPSTRSIDIVWYDFQKDQYNLQVLQTWNGGGYTNTRRINKQYGPGASTLTTTEEWSGIAWTYTEREESLYDSQGHLTQHEIERFSGASWVLDEGEIYQHTYASGDLVETLHRIWTPSTASYENYFRYVYSNFAVGMAGAANPQLWGVSLYPNPAQETIYIRANGQGKLQITLMNLQGQPLLTSEAAPQEALRDGWDVSGLAPGIYLLHVRQGPHAQAIRFIVN